MTTTVTVDDMSCEGCEEVVEKAVTFLDGVESVTADRSTGTVEIEGDVTADDAVEKIELAGYRASS